MVKGVNRQIIEINDTSNRYFERVLLFVSPEGSEISSRELNREAKEFLLRLTPEQGQKQGIRARMARRRLFRRLMWGGGAAVLLITGLILVFNFL